MDPSFKSLAAGAVLALLTLPGCVGWGSASLPPALTDAEQRVVGASHLPLTVGVVPHEYPAYSDALVDGLRGTGLFDHVALLDEFTSSPDLLAHVDRRIHGAAIIPLWTLLTFGVVPTSVDEDHGWSFWLGLPGGGSDRWHVECSHTGRTTLGWVALFEVVLPDRTVVPFTLKGSRRMRDRLSLAILEHRDDLLALGRRR